MNPVVPSTQGQNLGETVSSTVEAPKELHIPTVRRKTRSRSGSRSVPSNGSLSTQRHRPGVAVAPKPWSQLSNAAPPKTTSRSLSFVKPAIIEGIPMALCPVEATSKALKSWEMVLMGYVLGRKPYIPQLIPQLRRAWSIRGKLEIFHRGHGFLLFRFSDAEEMRRALEDGPWFISGRPLLLQKWKPDCSFEKLKLSTVPIWVRFPGLNLKYWTPELLSALASVLGKPLYMDEATAAGTRLEFARLCIEIVAEFSFPSTIPTVSDTGEKEEVSVEYEWKPHPCSKCQAFGHEEGICESKPPDVQTMIKADQISMGTIPATLEKAANVNATPSASSSASEQPPSPVPAPVSDPAILEILPSSPVAQVREEWMHVRKKGSKATPAKVSITPGKLSNSFSALDREDTADEQLNAPAQAQEKEAVQVPMKTGPEQPEDSGFK